MHIWPNLYCWPKDNGLAICNIQWNIEVSSRWDILWSWFITTDRPTHQTGIISILLFSMAIQWFNLPDVSYVPLLLSSAILFLTSLDKLNDFQTNSDHTVSWSDIKDCNNKKCWTSDKQIRNIFSLLLTCQRY